MEEHSWCNTSCNLNNPESSNAEKSGVNLVRGTFVFISAKEDGQKRPKAHHECTSM